MPPNSYIDALNFSHPEKLAEFVKFIGSDINLYNTYFEWEKIYCSSELDFDVGSHICEVCKKLNTPSVVKHYTESQIDVWWNEQAKCRDNISSIL